MIELTWKLFCQTGNIETYLLLKELEDDQEVGPEDGESPMDTKM